MRPTLTLGLAALALAGCNSALRETMRAGDEAMAKGDGLTAAFAYRNACKIEPTDADACAKADQVSRQVRDGSLQAARPACEAFRVDECLAALEPARRLYPEDPTVTGMVEAAAKGYADSCAALPLTAPEGAITITRCLEARAKAFHSPAYSARVAQERQRLAEFLESLAREQPKTRPGAAFALASTAMCIAQPPSVREPFDAQVSAFLTEFATPISLSVTLNQGAAPADLAGLCTQVQSALGPRARCGGPARSASELDVKVRLQLDPPEHTQEDEVRNLHYRSGSVSVPNQDYPIVARRLDRAQREYDRADRDAALARAACNSADPASSDEVCNRANALRRIANDRESELTDAQNASNNTPAYLDQDVYQDFQYELHRHHWQASYRVEVDLPAGPSEDSGVITFDREEHVGFPDGGLAASPRRDPTQAEFLRELSARVKARMVALLGNELQRRGEQRLASCGSPGADYAGAWLDCWSAGTLWKSNQVAAASVALIGGRADPLFPKAPCVAFKAP